jgi:AraC family transcriptional regulator of adaptative response / DNA-3-methyladenine glycosylase II
MELDFEACYRAFESRDARFDGRFFIGVLTTGVYCRPICPAPMPKRENVAFYAVAAAAAAAGLRPCKRCRAEAAPGSAAWLGGPAVVSQAVRLIESGFLDRRSVAELARDVSVSERQLRRLFDVHLGASPAALAAARRLSTARLLIDQTNLPFARAAFEAGYTSVRQFNDAVRAAFGTSPSRLRQGSARPAAPPLLELRVAFRPPYDWERLIAYLAQRATPGVESVDAGVYRRSVRSGNGGGILEVPPPADRELTVRLYVAADAAIAPLVRQIRHLLDLDADPLHVQQALASDARLAPLVAARPGVRIPGCIDGFELAVRAILGQQVSVRAATSVAGRLAEEYGTAIAEPRFGLRRFFPVPEELADAEPPWLPRARSAAIRALARAVRAGLLLEPGANPAETVAALRALPGVGPWTASYVALRALGDPDAFPEADLGLRKSLQEGAETLPAAGEVASRAEAWRPWRGYAAMLLWQDLGPAAEPARQAA